MYSDFEDVLGPGEEIELPGTGGEPASPEFGQFRKKAEHFLKQSLAEETVAKVRSGQSITQADITDLEPILVAAGIGDDNTFAAASERAGSFGLFIRSIVGLDRAAAKEACNDFLDDKRYSKNQIEFVNLIIGYLTEHGAIEPARIYDPPFTAVAPQGPEGPFGTADVDEIIEKLTKTAA